MSARADHNQRALAAEIARVAHALERHLRGAEPAAPERERPPRLEALVAAFGLSPFERDVLLLCAGVELEARFAALCREAGGAPTFSLALAALDDPHWSALAPGAPLRHHRLVELAPGESVVCSPLRIDERVLHHLAGVDYLDERLVGLVEPPGAAAALPPSHAHAAAGLAAAWLAGLGRVEPVASVCGRDASARTAVAAAACAELGLVLHAVRAGDLPAHPAERETLVRLWRREAVLVRSGLLVDVEDDADGDVRRRAAAFADAAGGIVCVGARDPLGGLRRQTIRVDVGALPAAEQRALWEETLGERAASLNGSVDRLVSAFDLAAGEIEAAGRLGASATGDGLPEALWHACRVRARPGLDELAQRLDAAAVWDDLVLPAEELATLAEIALHVRARARVYEQWGFARKGTRGLGVSALFAGASGTGKTMAAEVLAGELRLDLYRIDLSQIVSKYIGETEKNLRRVFDAAETGGAVLLFDEADALFGKRSEVKDSHDRYANIEVSYLLQRMEAYRGLAILTTNRREALDDAFLRRIRFAVQFPFPDHTERAAIWQRILPAEAPTGALDVDALAGLSLAGGNIRNVALNAAFLAADEDAPISMRHLARAAARECAKLERPLTETALREWL